MELTVDTGVVAVVDNFVVVVAVASVALVGVSWVGGGIAEDGVVRAGQINGISWSGATF